MLSVFVAQPQGLARVPWSPGGTLAKEAIWFDLLEPSAEEERAVEEVLGIDVPTREEMREIEASNRLYEENGAVYMTATIVTKLDTDLPQSTQVTFILNGSRLVTNRYTDPLPFRRFIAYAETHPATCSSPMMLLAGLLESIINRIADVIERVAADLDQISQEVFATTRRRADRTRDFRQVLGRVGQCGEQAGCALDEQCSKDADCASGTCLLGVAVCALPCSQSQTCPENRYCAEACSVMPCASVCLPDCLGKSAGYCEAFGSWKCQKTDNTEGIQVSVCQP